MSAPTRDRIEKRVRLKAPVSRVWHAVSDAGEFGKWFGVKLAGPFVAGREVRGVFEGVPPAEAIAGMERSLGLDPASIRAPEPNAVFCTVEKMEPEHTFSFRWIPYGIDASIDPKNEPTTLVTFRLEKDGDGTVLTITESGFDGVPAHRQKRAFLMNDHGWAAQAENIKRYVEETHVEGR